MVAADCATSAYSAESGMLLGGGTGLLLGGGSPIRRAGTTQPRRVGKSMTRGWPADLESPKTGHVSVRTALPTGNVHVDRHVAPVSQPASEARVPNPQPAYGHVPSLLK